ncbi:MAG TPA: hypothetical protein VNH11_20895 [Pirellulales bacterium]|nr:hypothetical protein [Pirellulales bacterium]
MLAPAGPALAEESTDDAEQQADPRAARLAEIVANVRAAEALYENAELLLTKSFNQHTNANDHGGVIETSSSTTRCVLQDGMLYLRLDGEVRIHSGKTLLDHSLQGFDGERTRILEKGAIGNIYRGRFWDIRVPRPHTLVLGVGWTKEPLSALLSGAPFRESWHGRALYEGEERLGEVDCVRIRLDLWREGEDAQSGNTDWIIMWLAPHRSHLPVRVATYVPGYSRNHPIQTGGADDFREISPGIWFPFRVSVRIFDEAALWDNKVVPRSDAVYRFDKVDLNPRYPKSLFSDIEFPPGTPVYELEGDKIIRQYTERAGVIGSLWANKYKLVAAHVLLGACGLLVWAAVRRRRRAAQPAPHAA